MYQLSYLIFVIRRRVEGIKKQYKIHTELPSQGFFDHYFPQHKLDPICIIAEAENDTFCHLPTQQMAIVAASAHHNVCFSDPSYNTLVMRLKRLGTTWAAPLIRLTYSMCISMQIVCKGQSSLSNGVSEKLLSVSNSFETLVIRTCLSNCMKFEGLLRKGSDRKL